MRRRELMTAMGSEPTDEAGCGCQGAEADRPSSLSRRSAFAGMLAVAGMVTAARPASAASVEQPFVLVSGEEAWGADGDFGIEPPPSGLRGVAAAATPTSPNGFPVSPSAAAISVVATTVPGTSVQLTARSGDVTTLLMHVARRFNEAVERLVVPGCWGWAYRENVNSPGSWSNHASGTAIDLNAPRHPNGSANTFSSAQVAAIRVILGECRGVVRWGGDYSRTKDEMHFEIDVQPSDPRLTGAAINIRDPQGRNDDAMRNLLLAKRANSREIWVGDGMQRRLISDPVELANIQYWVALRGGDAAVRQVDDLRLLGKVI